MCMHRKRIKGGIQLEFMSICSSHWVLKKYIHEQEEWLFKNKVVRLMSTWSGRLHRQLQGGMQLEFQEYLFQSLSTKYEMNLHTITRLSSKEEIPFLFGGLKGGLGSRPNPISLRIRCADQVSVYSNWKVIWSIAQLIVFANTSQMTQLLNIHTGSWHN